jgi:type I site-specific restriction endonuclease
MSTEADTCREYVVPKLQAAGWENEPHAAEEAESAKVKKQKTSREKHADEMV